MSGLIDGDPSDALEKLAKVNIFSQNNRLHMLLATHQDLKAIMFCKHGKYYVQIWHEDIASANGWSEKSTEAAIDKAISKIPKGWLK